MPAGTKLSITGVVKNGRAQIVYNNAARWVTAKYLSTTKPSMPVISGGTYAVEKGLKPNAIKVHRAALGPSRRSSTTTACGRTRFPTTRPAVPWT